MKNFKVLLAILFLIGIGCETSNDSVLPENALEFPGDECVYCLEDDDGPAGGGGTGGGTPPACTPDAQFGSNLMYFHRGNSSSGLFYSKSTNGGTSWTSGTVNNGAQTSQGPAFVEYKNNFLVYYKGNSSSNIFYSNSTNGGSTWGGNLWVRSDAKTSRPPSAVKMGCRVYLAYKGDSYDDIWVTSSANGLTGWTAPNRAVNSTDNASPSLGNGYPPYITTDGTTLYLFWIKRTTNRVYMKTSTNGTTWTPNVEITAIDNGVNLLGRHGVTATIANNNIYMTYPLHVNGVLFPPNALVFVRTPISGPTPIFQSYIEPGNASLSNQRPSITALSNGNIVVAFKGETQTDVYSRVSTDGGQTWTTQITSGNTNSGPYISSY